MNIDSQLYGVDLFGEPIRVQKSGPLAERFEFPPFSVLNAREGEWQERKRAWIALGIRSELGRGDQAAIGGSPMPLDRLANAEPGGSKMPKREESAVSGTSIFDPVLCELAYRWFCPEGGQVVDPFAGGSVRGLLAALLGRRYWGCDLSRRQLEANREQAKIAPEGSALEWVEGDAIVALEEAPAADFIFACPPYGDLERYSDDPRDLSTMDYHAFLAAYKRIILRCAKVLKPDRFACFVVGDFRDKRTGNYRGFVADTINAFREVGLGLYNDAVLITAVGSLPVRVSGTFEKHRKLGKTHQNVLVFAKGDPRKAFECHSPSA